ncbi:MAG: prepilin peptidase [SAR324 cluster bacterium]|nr:prepilin peptidase [SAR324 cluster bacterium]
MLTEVALAVIISSLMSPVLIRCVSRMPEDKKLWDPPLQCSSCQKKLSLITRIPVLGFFLVHRRCSSCRKPLPAQPLWIEISTVSGTLLVFFFREEASQIVIDLVFVYAMIVITFIDWNVMLIEPRVIVLTVALRLLWLAWFDFHSLLYHFGSMCIAAGAFYFIGFFYETLRRRQGLGDGDAAVIGVIALWTGWESLSMTVLIAALGGLLVGGGILILNNRPLASSRIPFAPFLCLGGGIVYYIKSFPGFPFLF